ncbi:hypothetical protein SFRURICE_019710 [Spodoptera frugiperda]|nr:hypothetical protein SFRURICE_019710 [Spodoptera frugiperda]
MMDEGNNFVTTALIPIDINIPGLTEVVSNINVEERSISIYKLKLKTAPPINIIREQRAEELAWIKLFSNGHNGLREERPFPITPLDYYQTRVMSSDKRLQNNEYLFYTLSIVEFCKAQQNAPLTSTYLTLSCNDLNWPDMLNALLVAGGRTNYHIEDLTFSEKRRLVEVCPVTLSRHFMMRFNALFAKLQKGNNPILGKIIYFWWRVEFQLRGSPHIHMVIWCADMPPFDTTEDKRLLEFGFPRPISGKTEALDDDQATRNGGEFAIWYEIVSSKVDVDEDQQDIDAYESHIENVPVSSCITLLDNLGRMRKRTRPAILRTRYFTLASDPEAHYYSLILTHIPFQAEEELLDRFDTARAALQAGDTTFVDILNNLRVGELTMDQLDLILDDLHAVDISLEAKTYGQCPRKEFVSGDPNKTGGILSALHIGIGSRVMLRRNINVNHGLVNGAIGT